MMLQNVWKKCKLSFKKDTFSFLCDKIGFMKIKKLLLTILLIFFFSNSIFAQITVDPNHEFYEYAQNWYLMGLVEKLPPLRPYSKLYVNKILESVIQNGNSFNQEKAKSFYEDLNGKPWYVNAEVNLSLKLDSKDGMAEPFVPVFPGVTGDASLFYNFVSLGYDIGFSAYNKSEKNYRPLYSSLSHDSLVDPSSIGPYNVYLDINDVLSIGNETVIFQCGINRLGFSPFITNSLALNSASYHSANLELSIIRNKFSYSQIYSVIGSSTNYDGSGLQPNKYLTFHQFSYKILPKLELSYYETVIFGQRFDPSYFIPSPYMVVQGIGGFNDNLQMGILINYNIFKGFLWATDIFVDDLSVNDLIKLNFDTKIRVAAKTGIIYAFDSPVLNKISLDYTIVTPYTYAHSDSGENIYWYTDSTFNYQNYTNNGIPIGSNLPPNSDGINLSFSMNPVKNLSLSFNGFFARHANSAETLSSATAVKYLCAKSEKYATDGSIFMHQALDNEVITETYEHLNFLTQKHKMYIVQLGLSAKYSLPRFKYGSFSLKASYNFEYIHNKGVDSNIYPGGTVSPKYDESTKEILGYNISGDSNTYTQEQIVELYYNKWTSSFYNIFNNYFYIGFEYKF